MGNPPPRYASFLLPDGACAPRIVQSMRGGVSWPLKATATPTAAPTERAAQRSAIIADIYFPLQLSYRDPATFQRRRERRSPRRVSLSQLCTVLSWYGGVPVLIRQG